MYVYSESWSYVSKFYCLEVDEVKTTKPERAFCVLLWSKCCAYFLLVDVNKQQNNSNCIHLKWLNVIAKNVFDIKFCI